MASSGSLAAPAAVASVVGAASGRGVRVLIVDSGVDSAHPRLSGAIIEHFAVEECTPGGLRVVPCNGGDQVGHGTAVASIVRRHAPEAALTSVRILGKRSIGTTRNLFAALDWAVNEGFDVINTSLGTTYLATLPEFKSRLDLLYLRGSVIVSASSNLDPEIIEYPAHFTSVVSVTHAPLAPDQLVRTPHLVEFGAHGVDVDVAWREGESMRATGSSFAAPHVTALVARLKQQHPDWNASQVKSALYTIAGRLALDSAVTSLERAGD